MAARALQEQQQPAVDDEAAPAAAPTECTKVPTAPRIDMLGNNGTSLQDAFKAFRKERKAFFKVTEGRSKQGAENRPPVVRTDEFKEALRKKFLEKALSYQGVPYHPRYHKDAADPHHNAPLYLDCCGLVRRTARDLAGDFGFWLGRYNQSYQFDTLPTRIPKEEMKPGDLVFLKAPYYDKTRKPQTHDMQHVEIWLGDGDKTLGARWSKGVVEIHDSYDFVSKRYGPNEYFFCSIDPWLSGECKSHRRGYPWPVSLRNAAKNSIFAPQSEQDAEDDADATDGV
mmetsp:Transcript_6017/g.15336  ORF Transcript_6017/g.15336 Transcript_6017/m.15336 type:complete len:284 (+) Transcript_6017:39-890(+)